ncbi:hypothetical protein TWF694_011518 [Orbilia ellipsospora]|uniref:Uncharacterized protein n=1 Tax=Orbilia ellipsospora TaxID=2528407 RepID=A0AAV9X5U1_9PEZI
MNRQSSSATSTARQCDSANASKTTPLNPMNSHQICESSGTNTMVNIELESQTGAQTAPSTPELPAYSERQETPSTLDLPLYRRGLDYINPCCPNSTDCLQGHKQYIASHGKKTSRHLRLQVISKLLATIFAILTIGFMICFFEFKDKKLGKHIFRWSTVVCGLILAATSCTSFVCLMLLQVRRAHQERHKLKVWPARNSFIECYWVDVVCFCFSVLIIFVFIGLALPGKAKAKT